MSGQHAHLRAALDLEDADRVGLADHVVDRGLGPRQGCRWTCGRRVGLPLADDQLQCVLTDRGQHAEREARRP